jgi:hypothetical protein
VTAAHVRRPVRRALAEDHLGRRYQVPRQAASDREDKRLVHDDLLELSTLDLRGEAWRVVGALAARGHLRLDERDWLIERLGRVRAEQGRRATRSPLPFARLRRSRRQPA